MSAPDHDEPAGPGRHHPRRRRRGWLQRLVIFGGIMSSLALAASAGTFGYVYRKAEKIPRVELSSVLEDAPEASGEPQNYLIVGVDNADGLPVDDPVRNDRDSQMLNDVVMVLRIDPSERKAELLSLPRDLWVPYGDTGDHARINTAISRGNGRPDVLIALMRDYLGIPIHHYVQLEFAGFRDLVAAIDGVPVYFPYPARDRNSGLSILQTGCVTLDPVQALAYARARHYDELIDGEWVRDPRSDLGRIARQQDFIRRALDRAASKGARNPGTLDRLLDVALSSVTIDDALTTGDIFDLAQRFRQFDPDSLKTYTVPVERTFKGAADVVLLQEAAAEPTLARFRGDPEPEDTDDSGGDDDVNDIAPASVRLTVRNGSGAQGQASEAADGLTGAGFIVVGRGEEPGFGVQRTTIRYPAGSRPAAELVSRWLVAGAELEELPEGSVEVGDGGVVLVTGTDWAGVSAEPATSLGPDDPPAMPGDPVTTTSTTSTSLGGSSTSSTTSTTVPPDC